MTTKCAPGAVTSSISGRTTNPKDRGDLLLPIILVCLCLLTFLPTLGITRIIDPSDGFFAETAREMLETHNFLTPTLNYEAWNDKPILNHWLVALSYLFLGVSEYASRLPAALCATGLCLTTFCFGKIFLGRKTAFLAALMLLSSYLFSILGRVSLTDMPLALFVNLGLYSMFVGVTKQSRQFRLLGWTALGLAFLTKGPICLLILIGSFLLYFLSTKQQIKPADILSYYKELQWTKGLAIVAAIAVPWFAAAGIQTKGQFLFDFFVVQNFQRATGALVLNHNQPFWFYVPVLLLSIFPFSALIPSLIPVVRKWWQKRHVQSLRIQFIFFCMAFCITVLGGFSLLKGKLPTYIMPLLPSLCLVLTAGVSTALKAKQKLFVLIAAATAFIASIAAIFIFPRSIDATGPALHFAHMLMIVYASTSVIFAICVLMGKRLLAFYQMSIACTILSAILIPFVFVEFYEKHQQDFAQILKIAMQQKGTLSQVWDTSPSAPFYFHKQVPKIRSFYDLAATVAFPGAHFVIAKKEYDDFLSHTPVKSLIASQGEWRLYSLADPKQQLLNTYTMLDLMKTGESPKQH